MKTHKILLTIGFIISAVSMILLFYHYPNLPEIIPTHKNFKGEVDGYGKKSMIFMLPAVNIAILTFIAFISNKPQILNVPVKVTDENRAQVYQKSQNLLGFIAVLVAAIFSILIIDGLGILGMNLTHAVLGISLFMIIGLPILIIFYFTKK